VSTLYIILAALLTIVAIMLLLLLSTLDLLKERARRKAAEDLLARVLDAMVAGLDVRIRRGQA
jgi:hypothetical protein